MGGREREGDTVTDHRSQAQMTEETELRGLANVAVVQAADFGKLHDLP
jgi:hypothetical protein